MSNPSSAMHWWLLTKDLGIPVPKTVVVPIEPPEDAEVLLMTCVTHFPKDVELDNPDCRSKYSEYRERFEAAAAEIGFPLFVRTDQISGKHQWDDTCYVAAEADLHRHIGNVIDQHGAALFMEGPGGRVEGLLFREFLELDAPFKAFNGMPVARERRYFVEDGEVICHHPYWEDVDNIETGLGYRGSDAPANWRELHAELNVESPDEVQLLTAHAARVSRSIEGAWSVDFAFSTAGVWYLIDMAVADRSWHPEHVVNEMTGHVVDGHLRIELAIERGESTVPVVYVELTVEEERLVLATLDPLASMAEPDTAILSALLDDILMPEGALGEMLASLADRVPEVPFPELPEGEPDYHTMTFNVTAAQRTLIETALAAAHSEAPGEGNRNAESLALICERFAR